MSRSLTLPQRLGLVSWAALLLLQLAWHSWLSPPQHMPMAFALGIALLPLLLPLLAIRKVSRALLWVGIVCLFYFCHGVSEAWGSPSERVLAVAEIALTLLLIGTLGAHVRTSKSSPPSAESTP